MSIHQNLIEATLQNISRIKNSIQYVDQMFKKSRSNSCVNLQNYKNTFIMTNSILGSPKIPKPSIFNSIYVGSPKNGRISKIFTKKNLKKNCKLHSHMNCEACRIKTENSHEIQAFKKKSKCIQPKHIMPKEYLNDKILIERINFNNKPDQAISDFKKILEKKLEQVNEQIQVKKQKIMKHDSTFCLDSLKSSVRSQFSQLKQQCPRFQQISFTCEQSSMVLNRASSKSNLRYKQLC